MQGFTLYSLGRIENTWVTDGLSEILSTFIFALFVFATGAQDILSRGAASSPTGRALASGVGLMLAVYCGFNASGACVNPCIALMFSLTGKIQWKKLPVYVICEFIGAFLAAWFTYGIYNELIDSFDGGKREMYGINSTAHIFTSFPKDGISKTTGFFDVFTGCGLVTSTVCMLIDPNNAKTASGLIPFAFAFLLYGILMAFGYQTGAPINPSIDISGRLFVYCAGYGPEVFSRGDYWFWVPPVACICGTVAFVTTYQVMIGNHLPKNKYPNIPEQSYTHMDKDKDKQKKSDLSVDEDHGKLEKVDEQSFMSKDSVSTSNTNSTYIEPFGQY